MKTLNNYYVDDNNNRWDCDLYTEDQAEKLSKTLENCSDCSGCSCCSDCFGCTRCFGCSGCSDCFGCTRCFGCSDCYGCTRCFGCSDCSGCYDINNFLSNPQRYTTPKIGSRKSNTTIYWVLGNIQVICGCFKGNLDEFEARVRRVHGNDEHLQPYLKQIEIMKYLLKN